MNTLLPVTFCGRTFTPQEVELMGVVAKDFAGLGVTEIAQTVCELLEWKRPNGRLKHIECRQLLERLQEQGLVTLPALRKTKERGPQRVDVSHEYVEPDPIECAARECEPLELAQVQGPAESRRWRELIERYHYLGCSVPFGANMRYWVRNQNRELACLLWTSPAWKMAPRDAWIGWNEEQRKRNLQGIVNNGRFLILPWVRVKGLASKILALSARQLPRDWLAQYGQRPLLMETLVDANLFKGTCYKASNWVYVGRTTGRGRMDRFNKLEGQAIKDIYVYPLCHNARKHLCSDAPEKRKTVPQDTELPTAHLRPVIVPSRIETPPPPLKRGAPLLPPLRARQG